MAIGTVTNVTLENGQFTITGTDTNGRPITVEASFQEYILLFTEMNMKGIDDAIAAMYDNTKYFSTTLQEISNVVSIFNTLVGNLKDPSDGQKLGNVLSASDLATWKDFFTKYKPIINLGEFAQKDNPDIWIDLSHTRAVLDNINEFQTTVSGRSEQWNTRTSSIVNARGTAVDLAKTLLGYIKDAMSSTTIR